MGLITSDGLRLLLTRKFQALRSGRREAYANGDLAILDRPDAWFDLVLHLRHNFDNDKDVKLMLHPMTHPALLQLTPERWHACLSCAKYTLTAVYMTAGDDEEEDDWEDTPHTFLEREGDTWVLAEGFEMSTGSRWDDLLQGLHFLQRLKRCIRCDTYMSSPDSLCMQCACSLDACCEPVFCSICLEDTKAGEVVQRLPCRHMFHADCLHKMSGARCPMCRKSCAGCPDLLISNVIA